MTISFTTALEMILYGSGPAFRFVEGDERRLIVGCLEWLQQHQENDDEATHDRIAEQRAIYILDRLLPLDDPRPFERFRNRYRFNVGLYAWGRRAPDEMLATVPERGLPSCGSPVMAAWIASRRSNDELLTWYEVCRAAGWSANSFHAEDVAIEEYCRRAPDRTALLRFLDVAEEKATWQASYTILRHLLRDAAATGSPGDAPPDDLVAALESLGEIEFATACRRLRERGHRLHGLASYYWIEQHTLDHLDRLVDLESQTPYWPSARIAKILPKDRLEVWPWLLGYEERGLSMLCEFVQWLDPGYRDVLVPEFQGVSRQRRGWRQAEEWAACALHAWLHKAPRPVVERWADGAEHSALPLWQAIAIDRFLYAPPALRPPPLLHDIQAVEADFRLLDALNVRGG